MTLDDAIAKAHLKRWNLVKTTIPYVAEYAFPTYFRQHPEIGSPIDNEYSVDGSDIKIQPFTGAVLKWTPGIGVEEIRA